MQEMYYFTLDNCDNEHGKKIEFQLMMGGPNRVKRLERRQQIFIGAQSGLCSFAN